ncbi:MAG: DUF2283 domain-containing protein [Nanoarchaeota archaeon]
MITAEAKSGSCAGHGKIVDYDRENDIISIHNGFSNDETFKGNIVAGDLILDISTKSRIRGIEILNASGFLKEFAISTDTLEHLEDARFETSTKPSGITIGIFFKTKAFKHELPAKIAVPLSARGI